MRRFYGVYLESTSISTVLDIIRFLAEPDSIRFSHITLRGPYDYGLDRGQLRKLNDNVVDRAILMLRAEAFLSEWQSTAVILVELLSLNSFVHKPDFPDGKSHITLYDGKDRDFCVELCNLARRYNWENTLQVGHIQEITTKKPIDQEFLPFFVNFYKYFRILVGDPAMISEIRYVNKHERLDIIESILEKCTDQSASGGKINDNETCHQLSLIVRG